MRKDDLEKLIDNTNAMRKALKEDVFGQDKAIDDFIKGYFQAMLAGNDKKDRPKATFLFAGPPGVGKTFLAQKAAEIISGFDDSHTILFKRFDMSGYSGQNSAVGLFGANQFSKNATGGTLTEFVHDNPHCVVLLDEIEKAHATVIYNFLQILDGGSVLDKKLGEVSFADAILIFTTNAGKQLYNDNDISDLASVSQKVIINALRTDINPTTKVPYFPAPLCSRFASGNVVMFNHMTAASLRRVAEVEIRKLVENFSGGSEKSSVSDDGFGVDINIADEVYTALLLSEGASADARTISGRARSFFNSEMYELLRLINSKRSEFSVHDLKKVDIKVDLSRAELEVVPLFKKDSKTKILVFEDEKNENETKKIDKIKSCRCSIVKKHGLDEAIEALKTEEFDFVMIDLWSGMSKENVSKLKNRDKDVALNIEDIDSPARDFYWFLLERKRDLPIYLLESNDSSAKDNKGFTDEEKSSFLKNGARGFLNLQSSVKRLSKTVEDIATDIHHEQSMIRLARANKLVSFETEQKLVAEDGSGAEITLFDFEMETAVDAEDASNILSLVSKPEISFDDVIGAKDAKEELSYFVEYLKNPKKYIGTGVKAPKGVLLYGPPGTGKTMLAKAVAHESDATFISVEGNHFLRSYVGEGSRKVHELFSTARKYAPSIVFIDEIDAIAKERTGAHSSEGREATLTAFLTEMDGFAGDPTKPVFVLAATNFEVDPSQTKSLDSALMRRFDRRIYIGLPGIDDRCKFLVKKVQSNKTFCIPEKKIEDIAMRSTGMSLADLDSAMELALRSAIRKEKTEVTEDILEDAFETFNFGDRKKIDGSQSERIAWHEAGHAFMCWYGGEMPSYLSIVSRGNRGGYMRHADSSEKFIHTKKELIADIRTALGGRAAEIVQYGKEDGVSTGASSDLVKATRIAKLMICTYGMDDDFGVDVIEDDDTVDKPLAMEVRTEVKRILKEQMAETIKIVENNKDKVEALVNSLMKGEYLNRDEIEQILGKLR